MQILNQEDLYLIGQYFEIDSLVLDKLYELNQKSFDLKYKLKGQKIKRLPTQDFKFKNITEKKASKARQTVLNNISVRAIKKLNDLNARQVIKNLVVAYP